MKIRHIIILLGYCAISYSQRGFDSTKISGGLIPIIKRIEKSEFNYHERDSNKRAKDDLENKGTLEDFYQLTKYPTLCIRHIAFTKMSSIDTFNFMPYIINSLKNNEVNYNITGCFLIPENYTDFLISLFGPKMTKIQKEILDSILIFSYTEPYYHKLKEKNYQPSNASDFSVKYRDKLLIDIKPESKYYSRLKSLIKIEDNPILIYAISKYKKPEDSVYIINGLLSEKYQDLLYNKSQTFWCYM